ncbi:hypothetical protein [Bdellovibrio sp. HCB337]|uniref:hypothetical protein n=1 Tax=Bdellovibrio sp. HCB337 TaxID=3394358 RepID=UPI0039A48B3A
MRQFSLLIIGGIFTITGIYAFFMKRYSATSYYQEVPAKILGSQRGIASDANTSSVPAPLSIRPPADAAGNLNITEEQIQAMEKSLGTLQKDVSVFKDTAGWVVRFHQPSKLMSDLGVQDNDLISFHQLQSIKSQPALQDLVARLEAVLGHLQK